MRAFLIIFLLCVNAWLIVESFRHSVKGFASKEVQRTNERYQKAITDEFK